MKLTGQPREALAEFFGTFVLMVFGLGVNAQVRLGDGVAGEFLSINIGWGIAVMMGVYACGGVTGAHINPAVTIALAACRRFAWRKVPAYIVAQVAGAVVASALVYLVYAEALDAFDGGTRQLTGAKETAGIFATYPREFADGTRLTTFPGGFLDQLVGTALLLLMIFAIVDERNMAPKSNLGPVLIGCIVLLIGMTFGYNAGYAINPARDFGPRLFTAMAGWGTGVFTVFDNWWWAPVAGPVVGGVIGGWLYLACVERHHPEVDDAA